ncbi:MAG TPA: hypothetical protein VGN05_10785 [Parvibaculum sp.]|jgi:hypothetical protein
MIDPRQLERTVRKIADITDEKTGQIIGLAALIACLPETANIDITKVNQVIDQSVRMGFGLHQVAGKAKAIARDVHKIAQETARAKSD